MKKSTISIIFIIALSSICIPQNHWEKTTGPTGGIMRSVVKGPDGKVISGTSDGRLFYSEDNAESWNQVDTVLGRQIVDFVYCDDGSILAATVGMGGVHRSTDSGQTWFSGALRNEEVWTLIKDPFGHLYAGTRTNGHIWKSTDNGYNWFISHFVTGSNNVNDLEYNSLTYTMFAAYNHYIYRSTDFGENWEFLSNGMGEADSIQDITFDDNGSTYAGSQEAGGAIYLSTNNGDSWTNMDTSQTFGDIINVGLNDILAIENYLLVATHSGVAKSTDMGQSWEFITNGLRSLDIINFAYDSTTNTIYAANQRGGIFISNDYGESWQLKSNGLNASFSRNLSFDYNETLYAASLLNGVHRSTDYGETWELIVNGITEFTQISVFATKDEYVITGTQDGYYVSTNRGDNWQQGSAFAGQTVYKIEEDLKGNWYFAIWGGMFYKSTDKGISWLNKINEFVFSITIDSSGNIFAGTNSGRIYKSTDDGESWFFSDNGLTTGSTIMDIAVSPSGRVIYTSTYGNGVFKSENEGENWVDVSQGGLEQKAVFTIGVRNDKEIFASIFEEDEIYYSSSGGGDWILVSEGMFDVETRDFVVDSDGYVYAGTKESVWRTKTNTIITDIETEEYVTPENFYLSQNYPNPFNPSTTISYSISEPGFVTLKVYDILGNEVAVLVNEEKTAGNFEVVFSAIGGSASGGNAYKLASGIYIYRLTSGIFTASKKLIILK
jgi:photosystem II stability/assembly factor-like uncharacterized protein